MSDPSTLLLLTCVTCTDVLDSSPQADSVCVQSHEQHQSDEAVAVPCVSPPESIRSSDSAPDASAVRSTVARATAENTRYIGVAPRPAPPERLAQLPAAADRSEIRPENRLDAASAPLLRFGSQSKTVSQLQERLRQLGYYKGALDGVYGDLTVEAVSEFQRAEGLDVDGVVGRSTWAKLQQPSRSSTAEKQPRTSSPNTAPTQKREAPPSQSALPQPSIRLPQPNPSSEQRPAEQSSPAQSSPEQSSPAQSSPAQPSPAQPSPAQPSPRLAEPPAMSENLADLGRAYFWVSGWAIVYIGGFTFIYRNSHRRRAIGSQPLNSGEPLEAVQAHPAQPVEMPKKAIQPHPAQPVETFKKAESIVSGNAPPFISHAISYNSAQSSKMGATRQPPFYQTGKLNSPPQSYVASMEDFGRGVTSTTAKSSTNTRVLQKTSPGTAKSTEHELVAIVANGGVAEPLRNLLLNLPGTSSADVPKQKKEKVNPFPKAVNQKKSDPSSSASKEPSKSVENADKLGALVAMLPPKDPETGTLYTYSLVSNGEGRFGLRGNELRINDETLFESQDSISHTIVVGRLDGRGTYAEKSFVLNFTKSQAHTRPVSKRPA
ncbi:peptidoglycan-binding protein [Phormidium tenue FACHB-886]|nr:peptidoglycan-binding protein [Phormidium tenue FACHB-886]